MDIPELKAFIAVTQARSFSKAASQLHISQPAISRRIQSLESSLEQKLFDRDGHTIHLTKAGNVLLPKAQDILEQVSQTETTIKSMGDIIQGPLNIAISHHFAEHYLAEPLAQFSTTYPKVNLSFQFLESEIACLQVLNGQVDLGLVTLPPDEDYNKYDKLRYLPLYEEVLHIMASHTHILTAHKTSITLTELCQHQAILPPLTSHTGRQITQQINATQTSLTSVIECNAFTSLKTLLQSGLGWGLLPTPLLSDTTLQQIQTTPPLDIRRSIGIVSHKNRQAAPAATAFETMQLNHEPPPVHKANHTISL